MCASLPFDVPYDGSGRADNIKSEQAIFPDVSSDEIDRSRQVDARLGGHVTDLIACVALAHQLALIINVEAGTLGLPLLRYGVENRCNAGGGGTNTASFRQQLDENSRGPCDGFAARCAKGAAHRSALSAPRCAGVAAGASGKGLTEDPSGTRRTGPGGDGLWEGAALSAPQLFSARARLIVGFSTSSLPR
ncbi:hypothetical protein HPB50_023339 [Hyalomma asiaticum]|uniref:Uncharacterized protein n=1 Tax=Hyalomma asiaticum TaxID=266040 RepID=A0ACB7TNB2_HYAAI|nr:hypothetical protein HPB50_023339 [Hyalomma asiaticum]